MIIVDTSIWIDHFHSGDAQLASLLTDDLALIHPFVIGEIALGSLRDRPMMLKDLRALNQAPVADHDEVMDLIERYRLGGSGIGYVDAHLIASTKLQGGSRLWSRDKRLAETALKLSIGYTRFH